MPESDHPEQLSIELLDAHPANSNVMPTALLEKLTDVIRISGRYPPVIVRPVGDRYQILDGHHRVAVLRRLDHTMVRCVVWEADEEQALMLLATLNRLRGDDQPRKRAALVAKLSETMDVRSLARRLPEDGERVKKMLALHAATPPPTAPKPLESMPVCLTFFVLPAQRSAVERVLRESGGSRETALLDLLGIEGGSIDA